MTMPEECKPFEASFSDGCPPADWCIGCTVCDCDANGRWDCHILSFCDGKEKKKKVKSRKPPSGRRSQTHKKKNKTLATTSKTPQNKNIRQIKNNRANTMKTLPPRRIVKKYVLSKHRVTTQNNNKTNQFLKKRSAKPPPTTTTLKNIPQPIKPQPKKPQPKKPQPKKPLPRKPQPKVNRRTKMAGERKPGNRSKAKPRGNLKKILNTNNNNDTVKLGQKIVKHVMSTVQKLIMKEMNKFNATRLQRSVNDCGKVKKNEKMSYNVKSNAVVRNKNKYKRKQNDDELNTYKRYKRDIPDAYQDENDNFSVIKLLPDNSAVLPLETVRPGRTDSTTLSDIKIFAPSSTAEQTNYYKYSVSSNVSDIITSTESMTIHNSTTATKQQVNATENLQQNVQIVNVVVPVKSDSNVSSGLMDNITITASNPDINDLKFSKWYIIKIKNDKKIKALERIILTTSEIPKDTLDLKITEDVLNNTKYQRKDVVRSYGINRKQEFKKIVTKKYKRPNSTKMSTFENKTDVTGLQNILHSLITELNKNHTARAKTKPKVSIMKEVRRFFHKLFSKKKTGGHKIYGLGTKEDHTLQILCDNLGPCKINKKNKWYLKYKLKKLNRETETILKTIRTIKGLLHLLDLPYNNKRMDLNIRPMDLNKINSFKNDVHKLSTVLRDEYNIEGINASLTDSQQTQILYIKKYTQTFIESIKKFVNILNDTLVLIRPPTKVDRTEYYSRKEKNAISFKRIKNMLKKYNLLQNTFMKKMYEFLNGVENKTSISPTTTTEKVQTKSRDQNIEMSRDQIIEKYSRSLIENLKRIKNLAEALSSKRKKRNARVKDEAVEYLLTLMEYLIKQNQPLDTAPANDGIDFLIDAIKNAPDIKPFRMKVLDIPTPQIDSRKDVSVDREISTQFAEDSDSDSNQILNTDKKSQENEQTTLKDIVTKSDSNWHTEKSPEIDDVTQKAYKKHSNGEMNYEITTNNNIITMKRSQDEPERADFDKLGSNAADGMDNGKVEFYAGEVEEDDDGDGDVSDNTFTLPEVNSTTVSAHNVENIIQSTTYAPETTDQQITTTESKKIFANTSESEDSISVDINDDKKSKLDWIEETFDREIREFSGFNYSNTTPSLKPLSSSAAPTTKRSENISGITAELEDNIVDTDKKSSKILSTEDVMYKKQMDFLNSLDYGTDKSELDETEIKNDARSTADAFPAYFV